MLFWSVLFVIIAVVLHIWGTLTLRSTQKRTEEKNIIFSYISICISVLMVVYTILFNAGILIDPDSFLTSFFSSVDTSKIPLEAVTFRGHSYYLYDPGESIWDEVLRNCSSKQGYPAVVNNKQENKFLYEYMCEKGKDAVFLDTRTLMKKRTGNGCMEKDQNMKIGGLIQEDNRSQIRKANLRIGLNSIQE